MEKDLIQKLKSLFGKVRRGSLPHPNPESVKAPPSRSIQRYIKHYYKDPQAAIEKALKSNPGAWHSIRIDEEPMPDTQKWKSTSSHSKSKRKIAKPRPASDDELAGFSFHEVTRKIDQELKQKLDESFQEMLLRKIDESGLSDVECYNRAHIDRRMFSKIRCDRQYRPSKQTALAFAIALRLNLKDTGELIGKAGYFMSYSNKSDVIVRYFIKHRCFNLDKINEVLYYYDQSLLGSW